jgi:aminoglycoside phosphotransferase (APT) family kinase protein
VVSNVTKGTEAPPLLELHWLCQRWGTLPNAGGIFDQDYKTMTQLSVVAATYKAVKARKIFKMTPEDERVIISLVKMGIQ